MLYKIRTMTESKTIENKFPDDVIAKVSRVAEILDTYYDSQGIDGGYILITEYIADLNCVRDKYFDYTDTIYEFKDEIDEWVSLLYLIGTEYSVTLITKSDFI